MKKLVLLFVLIFVQFNSFAKCVITCDVRYLKRVYYDQSTNVGNYYGDQVGSNTIYAPPGGLLYGNNKGYEDVWSKTYTTNVTFFSGYEANEFIGSQTYNDHSIIAIIKWDNGGSSCIVINKWITNMKYIDAKEVMYYNTTGEKIEVVYGQDAKDFWWEIEF